MAKGTAGKKFRGMDMTTSEMVRGGVYGPGKAQGHGGATGAERGKSFNPKPGRATRRTNT